MLKHLSFPFAVVACCLVFPAIQSLAIFPSLVLAEEDDDEDDVVHDLMEKTHAGKKSPWKTVARAVNADPIDWSEVDLALPRFEKMSLALAKAKDANVRDVADGYIGSVKELTAQANKRDTVGTRKALKSLSQSCADCHYKDGPGGKLDD